MLALEGPGFQGQLSTFLWWDAEVGSTWRTLRASVLWGWEPPCPALTSHTAGRLPEGTAHLPATQGVLVRQGSRPLVTRPRRLPSEVRVF